jgi:methionyl-tRNA formyltransferase
MRIIFMGTPEFAVPSLDILFSADYDIAAVITSPDRMGGRGRKTPIVSAVKKYALNKGLKVLQPTNLKSAAFVEELRELKADIQIVVAFRMLPQTVWDMPPLGTYNLHGSLLPAYRGAAPINWAIINGETITGVTSFKLKHAIDTGSVLLQKEMNIFKEDSASDLHDRMMYLAADTVLESVQLIESRQFDLKEQDDKHVSHAPKLNKDNTKINFDQSAETVYNFIRGLSAYPGAWFELNNSAVKIFRAELSGQVKNEKPGTLLTDNKSFIRIACKDHYIEIKELQYPGKRKMEVTSFLNGFDLEAELKDIN